ncbi:scavenger receptor class F member 1-like [Haliotis asinina]|uniref:scavenger receptor class F member 1-like n=1 Tax=Haliotis asinina TaxID=109174 RepID=UPI0035324FE5
MAHIATSTKASPCKSNQHCSDCTDHGICRTECEQGYFDKYCSSRCSRNCQNHTCKPTSTGIGRCTRGCIPGYRGDNCNRPCTEPGSTCRRCQGRCEGGYCYQGSSCVSGCFDSYYGSSCRNCSSTCKTCNRKTGTCEECLPSYLKCEDLCKHCLGPCEAECVKECPSSLNQSICGKECNDLSKFCINGCIHGFYGAECSSQCTQCHGTRCSNTGACLDGCNPGYFGPYCTSCPINCAGGTCDSQSGSCVHGCITGYYGDKCGHTCDTCTDGACDQSGDCPEICISEPCTTGVITTEDGINSTKPEEKSSGYLVYLIIPILIVQTVMVSVCVCYFCYRKRMSARRESRTNTIRLATISSQEPDTPAVDYQPLHRYYEIREEDIDTVESLAPPRRPTDPEGGMDRPECVAPTLRPADPGGGMDRVECVAPPQRLADPGGGMDRVECVAPPQRPESPEGGIGNMGVLADIFQTTADADDRADAAPGSSTRDSHTYTSLMTSVPVDNQADYITPTESEIYEYI